MGAVKESKAHGIPPALRDHLFGARDPVADHLRTLAGQRMGMSRLAHTCALTMLLLFSLGSLVGIAGESATAFLAAWQHGTLDLIHGVAAGVSAALVLCMDVASLYAALMLLMLAARGGPWRERLPHIAAILLADALEASTIAYMTWRYDAPLIGACGLTAEMRVIAFRVGDENFFEDAGEDTHADHPPATQTSHACDGNRTPELLF
jgi:hypothetical protein